MSALVVAQPGGYFPAAREVWAHAGIRCAIIASPLGGWNGYVQLPWGHRWRACAWMEAPLPDITYGPDADGWVGFDTGHAGDAWHPDDDTPPVEPPGWPDGAWPPAGGAAARFIERYQAIRIQMAHAFGVPLWTLPRLRQHVEAWAELVAAAAAADVLGLVMDAERRGDG